VLPGLPSGIVQMKSYEHQSTWPSYTFFAMVMTMLGFRRISGGKVYFRWDQNALRPEEWKTRRNDVTAKLLTIAGLRLHSRFGATIEGPVGQTPRALYLF
jgi:hypothetical protein